MIFPKTPAAISFTQLQYSFSGHEFSGLGGMPGSTAGHGSHQGHGLTHGISYGHGGYAQLGHGGQHHGKMGFHWT